MQIAQVIGGYTLGGADLLRRAMGKKKPEEMAKHRDIFVDGAEKNGLDARQGDAALRPDGEVRRLRLQQVARRRLRAGRLPDRVLQGAPPGRVHGGQPVARDGRHRQGARASATTRVAHGLDDAAAGRQRVELPLRAGRREADPLRPGRHQGHRRAGDRGDRRGARGGRPVPRPLRFLPARRQARSSTGARSRRWSAPARSTRSTPRRATLLASVGIALEAAEQRRARRRRRCRCSARTRADAGIGARRDARLDRRRAPAHEKAALGFYLSGHPFAGYAAELAPLVRTPLANLQPRQRAACWSPASSRRCACRRAGAARWRSSRSTTAAARPRSSSTTRSSTRARSLLREDQLVDRRGQGHAAHDRRRRAAGPAHHRRERLRPRRRPQALREGPAARVQRQRDAERLAEILAPFRPGSLPDHRRLPQPTASAARSSCPTRGASTSTTRCSRGCASGCAGERAGVY